MLNLWYLWQIPIAKHAVSSGSITKRVISLSSKKKLCDTNRLFRPPLRYSDSLTHFIPVKSISHSFTSTCNAVFRDSVPVEQLLNLLTSTCICHFRNSVPVEHLLNALTSTCTNRLSEFYTRIVAPKFTYLYVYMSITGFYARKAFPTIAYLYVYKLSSALRLT